MLQGKSIGFQVLKGHHPDSKECQKNGWDPNAVGYVIDEWLLLEYAVCYLPCNPDTLVEAVSKGSSYCPRGPGPRARKRRGAHAATAERAATVSE